MKLRYRQKLFLYFGVLFMLFTIGIILFEQIRERNFKTEALEEKLAAYTEIIYAGLPQNQLGLVSKMDQLQGLLPPDLRITIIDLQGKVLFDNSINDFEHLSNHLDRTEIKEAIQFGEGSDIRLSRSNQQKYLYFAKKTDSRFIRVALPYNIQLQKFLKSDNAFLYFIILFFGVFLFFIHITTKRLGNTIKQLRDFVLYTNNNQVAQLHFPNDEIGEIAGKIVENYHSLKESQKIVLQEKQKLLQHIQVLEEGICFLSAAKEVEYYNGLFIQYLNTITDEVSSEAAIILRDENFIELQEFLHQHQQHYFEQVLQKQGKHFSIKANIFENNSFEIIITDITKQEKTKQLKRGMTGNIAHELRTPITGIRAYLETVLAQSLSPEKQNYFIQRAFQQTLVLSDIIQDMGLIAKMEEAAQTFELQKVDIKKLIFQIKELVANQLTKKNIDIIEHLPDTLIILGNENLLFSLFKNLIDNAIRYAGENIKINISVYDEDSDYYYFSFYDTGVGVDNEMHLNRIFERFYRINEGRTRDTGGSGLGLSIVKNAVLFHKGDITAKNRKEGGLEFLFTLGKQGCL
ncbi:MAG: two-component sensor histidine kinase [Bacteroidetes bacterium]|nr:two-component sensor histidine kinase [Bacteroidota bacterium]